jgi:hypothetical protein
LGIFDTMRSLDLVRLRPRESGLSERAGKGVRVGNLTIVFLRAFGRDAVSYWVCRCSVASGFTRA